MWILIPRAPRPDAPRWPGRRLLSIVDAVAWPAGWLVVVFMVPKPGVLGLVIVALSILFGVRRCARALFRNERYRLTTWRWGIPVMGFVALGALIKALG